MYKINFTDDYIDFINCMKSENEDNNIIIKCLLSSIPSSVLLLWLISLNIWTMLEPLLLKKKLDKYLYQSHPVRCIIADPSDCGKSVFLTNLILSITNEFDKIYIYSPSLHQNINQ